MRKTILAYSVRYLAHENDQQQEAGCAYIYPIRSIHNSRFGYSANRCTNIITIILSSLKFWTNQSVQPDMIEVYALKLTTLLLYLMQLVLFYYQLLMQCMILYIILIQLLYQIYFVLFILPFTGYAYKTYDMSSPATPAQLQ